MFAVFLIILLLIVLAILLYDFVPDFLNWFLRIKIGNSADFEQWTDSIKQVNIRWLANGAPKVPKNENQRLKLVKTLKDIKKQSPICYWQDAALLKGVSASDGDTEKEAAQKLIERYIDIRTGEWKKTPEKADAAIIAYEILSSGLADAEDIRPAMKYMADMLKEQSELYGTVPYNTDIPDIRFVDTVGMIGPFLIKYGAEYDCPEYIEIALKQIAQYQKYGFSKDMKLPFHCFNAETEAQLGICGWGRGCGWWAVGIADSLKELLKCDGFDKEKKFLLKLNIGFLEELQKYINESGAVNRMMLNPSLPDSSASAMAAYSFSYMYRLTDKEEYRGIAEKIFSFLKKATRRNGVIDYSQGDTMGIGYYSSTFSVVPAAQGFTAAALDLLY